MATRIIESGVDKYRARCAECGALFEYGRGDVHRNYVRGGDWVSCPGCGHSHPHFGVSGIRWPAPSTPYCPRGR